MTYPILVARMPAGQSLRIICEDCLAESDITPDDLNQDQEWACVCGGTATFKHVEGDKCASCGRLGFWNGPTCSRRCFLQAEYAASLGYGLVRADGSRKPAGGPDT